MERLTKYICDRAHGAEGVSAEKLTGAYCRGKFEATALVERLAAIEDILGDGYDLNRLRELVEADRDGRCVVLLSNDDVYTIRGDIVNGIIKANCRDACKPPKSALKGAQHG